MGWCDDVDRAHVRPRRGRRWAWHLGRGPRNWPRERQHCVGCPDRRARTGRGRAQRTGSGARGPREGPRGAARGGEGSSGRRLGGSPEAAGVSARRKSRLPRTSSAPKARSSPTSRRSWSSSPTKPTPSSQKQGVELQLREIAPMPRARERIWRRRASARWLPSCRISTRVTTSKTSWTRRRRS